MIATDTHLKDKFLSTRKRTVDLCSRLSEEDQVVQPVEEVSPPKWHMGHTTWFFETIILKDHLNHYKEFHPQFSYLFNSYYESAGERLLRTNRGNITRPGVDKVLEYRFHVDRYMEILFEQELSDEVNELINLGIQHEQQHQELLYYDIKYILGHNPIFPAYIDDKQTNAAAPTPLNWLHVEEGLYDIGHVGDGFCFDNEMGRHQTFLHEFEIADRLVTNAEYLEFIEAGGYENFRYWLSEAWEWVKNNQVKAPEYWHKENGEWKYYSLAGGLKPLNLYAPVMHISYFEADAYAKWKGLRLPTEYEWEVACLRYGIRGAAENNLMERDAYESQPRQGSHTQFYGDCWEWTASAYLPYPYYNPPEGAVGEYNGKFMVNQMVLRGGSCATPASHIRPTYRNFFHPHLRWMFSGFRLAKHI